MIVQNRNSSTRENDLKLILSINVPTTNTLGLKVNFGCAIKKVVYTFCSGMGEI